MAKILLIEDDTLLASKISLWLKKEQHVVDSLEDAQQALAVLRSEQYDVILLDWALPTLSGLEFTKQLRARRDATPILMLTGKTTIEEKQTGFASGVDDYLTKPFDLREVSARVQALLRRPREFVGSCLEIGDLVLDSQTRKVTRKGEEVHLGRLEFALLEFLMRYPDRLFSADALVSNVWSLESHVSPEVVRKHVNNLRSKIDIEGEQSLIRNVYGVGYGIRHSESD